MLYIKPFDCSVWGTWLNLNQISTYSLSIPDVSSIINPLNFSMFPRRSVVYYSEVLEYSASYMGVFMICQDIMKKNKSNQKKSTGERKSFSISCSIYYVITKKTFWDLNFLKRDLKTFHVWLSSINVPVWLGAHGTVFQKLLLFHVLSMKNNTGCSVQKREPISAQQGGAGGTLYSTSNSAQYKLLFQRRETRAAHLKPFKEVSIWLASD